MSPCRAKVVFLPRFVVFYFLTKYRRVCSFSYEIDIAEKQKNIAAFQKYNFQKYNFHSSQNCVSTFRGENFREEFCIRRNVHFQLKSFYFCSKIISLAQGNPYFHFDVPYLQCDQKKLPNVHKSCLKMISLEKG